jgi:hypothetical protein
VCLGVDKRGAQNPETVFLSPTMILVLPKVTTVRPEGVPERVIV